ncbi:MAG: M28 family peptidase [Chloroflexota bacterium]|nr:MAG: M28 family peptidase [Chloroflexota bacterium]
MNEKTNPPIEIERVIRPQNSASPITAWFARRGFSIHLGPASRGLISLLVLLVFLVPSLAMLFPQRVRPASASADQFSSERAMAHLPVIAREPHPQGSPAQNRVRDYLAGQLADMGLEVEIQRTAGLENVVARLHGSDPTGAIVILAHYDTVSDSPGAGDNGSAVAALLEIMHALAAGPAPRNDVIALFDDGEEFPDIYAGTKAFVRVHPWMSDVRVAISIDTAVAGPISTNEAGPDNGWLVHALARSYTGGVWTSFSGGGNYNSTPFRNAGILVLALEDNYPYRQKHTGEDQIEIIRPASVQQMGEQTLAIARELGGLDLTDPWGEQETFFPVPFLGLAHYPEAWSTPLAVIAGTLLVLALGLALWRGFVSWRGLAVAFGTILVTAVLSGTGVNALKPRLPGLFGWETARWEEWPEIIPPNGGLAAAGLALLVLGVAVAGYFLARRWNGRADFSLAGLAPYAVPAVALAVSEPRTAYAFIWPVVIGSLGWIGAAVAGKKDAKWSQDFAITLAALPLVVILVPFLPGVVMSDGMKSLEILAVVEVLLLGVILPAVDGLFVRLPAQKALQSSSHGFQARSQMSADGVNAGK